ncbi:MAG TPA: threonine synthase [Gaiellaceae bacterium]|nr:threonine synthase [Gaiellaceae bacterium]
MPAISLRCRNCGHELGLEATGACSTCWGSLEPVYDRDAIRRHLTRESIAAGPASLWRYGALLPVETPSVPRLPPGFTPLVEAPRLAEALGLRELYLKLDTANPTHSFKDRVVAVACAKAQELGLTTLACSSTGNLAGAVAARAAVEGLDSAVFCPAGLEREKLLPTAAYGATIYEVLGSYDDCSRLTVELSFELPWAFVNVGLRAYYAEGSKTLAFEIAEQLGWLLPDAVVCPVASGALLSKVGRGFGEFIELGLVEGAPPRLVGAQAEGCEPVASAYREQRPVTPVRPNSACSSLAIGNPADGDHALAAVRASGGSVHSVPEAEIGPNMVLLAESSGVFGEAAAGVCLGALREAIAQGTVTSDDCVVLLVTGDGLKTPGPVADRIASIEIEANADALLEKLGVAA